jgi:hypothetical protein
MYAALSANGTVGPAHVWRYEPRVGVADRWYISQELSSGSYLVIEQIQAVSALLQEVEHGRKKRVLPVLSVEADLTDDYINAVGPK